MRGKCYRARFHLSAKGICIFEHEDGFVLDDNHSAFFFYDLALDANFRTAMQNAFRFSISALNANV